MGMITCYFIQWKTIRQMFTIQAMAIKYIGLLESPSPRNKVTVLPIVLFLRKISPEAELFYVFKADTLNCFCKRSPFRPLSRKNKIAFSITFSASSLDAKILLRDFPREIFFPSVHRYKFYIHKYHLQLYGTDIFRHSDHNVGTASRQL